MGEYIANTVEHALFLTKTKNRQHTLHPAFGDGNTVMPKGSSEEDRKKIIEKALLSSPTHEISIRWDSHKEAADKAISSLLEVDAEVLASKSRRDWEHVPEATKMLIIGYFRSCLEALRNRHEKKGVK